MIFSSIRAYLSAGFDESLVKLCKGMFASAFIGAIEYVLRHYVGHLTNVEMLWGFAAGTPAVLALSHWLKTTAGTVSPTSTVAAPPVTAEFSGDFPA